MSYYCEYCGIEIINVEGTWVERFLRTTHPQHCREYSDQKHGPFLKIEERMEETPKNTLTKDELLVLLFDISEKEFMNTVGRYIHNEIQKEIMAIEEDEIDELKKTIQQVKERIILVANEAPCPYHTAETRARRIEEILFGGRK